MYLCSEIDTLVISMGGTKYGLFISGIRPQIKFSIRSVRKTTQTNILGRISGKKSNIRAYLNLRIRPCRISNILVYLRLIIGPCRISGILYGTRAKHPTDMIYWVTQKLPQIYAANHATFPIQIRKITVKICGRTVHTYSF